METNEKTEVIEGLDNVISKVIDRWRNTEERMDSCVDKLQPKLLATDKVITQAVSELINKNIKTRTIFEITKDNISFVKELIKLVEQSGNNHIIRHLDNIVGNFSISDGKIFQSHIMGDLSTPLDINTAKTKDKNFSSITKVPQCIISSVKPFVEQQQYLFELMWEKAIPAEEKIKEIEEGIKPEVIEILKNPSEIQNFYLSLVESATYEIILVFPTPNAFKRQNKIGIVESLQNAAKRINKINIRILLPQDKEIENNLQRLRQYNNISINYIEPTFKSKITILVVDRKSSLIIEIGNDSKQTFEEATRSAIYDTHESKVMSFISIFETLWRQAEVQQVLIRAERMQKEFIDIAAHELRSPIQPILGISGLLKEGKINGNQKEFVDIIYRNAKRLQRLTEDVLDVTKIESNSLYLYKERVNLSNTVLDIVKDFEKFLFNNETNIRFECNFFDTEIYVFVDKNRISQVIANLIDNSLRFISNDGFISISLKIEKNGQKMAMLNLKDTGTGIDKEIMPRLFEKFVTKSFHGTGLGLYICKNIIESHGGRIWAENNADGKGATFSFNLPLEF